VFVVNTGRSRVDRYDAAGGRTSWGRNGSGNGEFLEPLGVLVEGGEVYVVDYGNARIQVFDYAGRFRRSWTVEPWKGAPITYRPGIVSFRDRLYASDPAGNAILVYSRRGEARGRIVSPELQEPSGLAVSKEGRLYAVNLGNGMVVSVDLAAPGDPVVSRFAPR
jgi:DNA-binding beta-propeller fold protein YncE